MGAKLKRAGPAFVMRTKEGKRRLRVSLLPDGRVWSVQRLTYYPGPVKGFGTFHWAYIWHNYGHNITERSQIYKELRKVGVRHPTFFLASKHLIIKRVD